MSRSNPWAHSIDYDKEIAQDEARVAYLSNPVVIKIAAAVEKLIVEKGFSDNIGLDWLLLEYPELAIDLGFNKEQCRVIMCGADLAIDESNHRVAQARYGEYQPGDFKAGMEFWRGPSLEPGCKWYEWYAKRETGRRGRKEGLKATKIDLSRHRRNKEKNG